MLKILCERKAPIVGLRPVTPNHRDTPVDFDDYLSIARSVGHGHGQRIRIKQRDILRRKSEAFCFDLRYWRARKASLIFSLRMERPAVVNKQKRGLLLTSLNSFSSFSKS